VAGEQQAEVFHFPKAAAPLKVHAASISAALILSALAAVSIVNWSPGTGAVPGLKSDAKATLAPLVMRRRASAYSVPRSRDVQGSRVATVLLLPSNATAVELMCCR